MVRRRMLRRQPGWEWVSGPAWRAPAGVTARSHDTVSVGDRLAECDMTWGSVVDDIMAAQALDRREGADTGQAGDRGCTVAIDGP